MTDSSSHYWIWGKWIMLIDLNWFKITKVALSWLTWKAWLLMIFQSFLSQINRQTSSTKYFQAGIFSYCVQINTSRIGSDGNETKINIWTGVSRLIEMRRKPSIQYDVLLFTVINPRILNLVFLLNFAPHINAIFVDLLNSRKCN